MTVAPASGQNAFDVVMLVLTVAVLPAVSAFMGARLAKHPGSLVSRYWQTMARGWLMVALLIVDWRWSGRSLAALGLDIPIGAYGLYGLIAVAAATLFLAVMLLNLRAFIKPARYPKLREQMREMKILPGTTRELLVFLLVAVTAGIWEELLFRGFLIWFLAPYAGVIGAALIATLAFGLGHAYQGWRGIPRTGAIGLIFAVAYIASGSLWWVMAAHAMLDLYGGLLAWRVSQMPEAAQPA
jgi:membrane protease YdiL (CAAX protease family)